MTTNAPAVNLTYKNLRRDRLVAKLVAMERSDKHRKSSKITFRIRRQP